jgi:hypothetical protein
MKAKLGALTEYTSIVDPDTRKALAEFADKFDFTELDDVAHMYQMLMVNLLAGRLSPEMSAEAREIINGATTLAAARAQGVFSSETAIDGVMALVEATQAAKNRALARQTTPNVIDAED